jgi:thiosulfate/3-mercaptopyruvate sulfurtransferase
VRDPVVAADALGALGGDVVFCDVRWYLDGRSGADAYAAGHIPGAVFVDLDAALAGPGSAATGRHPLPDPAAFADALAALGIGDDDLVVAYDDTGGVIAARLVWMLRAIGQDAALLDGGIAAYPGALSTTAEHRPAVTRVPRPFAPGRLATIDDAGDLANVVIDARPAERYAGGADAVDPRAGHIPGAHSLPCREHLGPDGRLLPIDELQERIAAVGIKNDSPVVSYCGSGVTACHNLLILEHAGFAPGRLFPGSWSQYAATDRPAATGSEP